MPRVDIKIWERHEKMLYDREEKDYYFAPLDDDEEWHKFTYTLETDEVRIRSYYEAVIFDGENNPQRCIRVDLSDDTYIFARYTKDAFDKLYDEKYTKAVGNSLMQELVNKVQEEAEGSEDEELTEEKKPGPLKRIWEWLW